MITWDAGNSDNINKPSFKFCKMNQFQHIYWLASFNVHNVFTRFKTVPYVRLLHLT